MGRVADLLHGRRHVLDARVGRRRPDDRRSAQPDLADVLRGSRRPRGSRVPDQDRAQRRVDARAAHQPQRDERRGAGRARRRGGLALQLPHAEPPLPRDRSLLRHDVRHVAPIGRRVADLEQEDRAEERLHPAGARRVPRLTPIDSTRNTGRRGHVHLQDCTELRGRGHPLHRLQGRREGARRRVPREDQPADGLFRRRVRHLQVPRGERQL
ncbi:hypothetical protein BDI4_1270004 [Burkholderia diffusa]|nr:hypothetical protein BDI4_1270004 [Burkholderia diffusa]